MEIDERWKTTKTNPSTRQCGTHFRQEPCNKELGCRDERTINELGTYENNFIQWIVLIGTVAYCPSY